MRPNHAQACTLFDASHYDTLEVRATGATAEDARAVVAEIIHRCSGQDDAAATAM